jgi:hypothetical protein
MYYASTSPLERVGGCLGASLFVVIETCWTTIAHEDTVTGVVSLRGPSQWHKLGHSSFAQFWVNVLFTPALLFCYRSMIDNPYLRVALFPFNVWCLEIVEGYLIMFIFGRNVAWEYKGADAFFHGNIKAQYVFPWLGLGLLVEFIWDRAFLPLAESLLGDESFLVVAGVVAVVLTAAYSPRMGIAGVLKSLSGADFSS